MNIQLLRNDEILNMLGKKIKFARVSLRMKQRDVSEITGLDRGVISRIENGQTISVDNLISILHTVKLLYTLEDLLKKEPIHPLHQNIHKKQRVRNGRSTNFFME